MNVATLQVVAVIYKGRTVFAQLLDFVPCKHFDESLDLQEPLYAMDSTVMGMPPWCSIEAIWMTKFTALIAHKTLKSRMQNLSLTLKWSCFEIYRAVVINGS
jgi:hypothetical protein